MKRKLQGHYVAISTVGEEALAFVPAPTDTEKTHGLPEIICGLKTFSARRINQIRNTPGAKLWQRNYYDHIIRNENELNQIRQYIVDNPAKWEYDHENLSVGAGNGQKKWTQNFKQPVLCVFVQNP